jgi:hypothetical protein
MKEIMVFQPSGLINDINDKSEIEYWGHDAGEFVTEEEIAKIINKDELQKEIETK